VFHLQYSHTLDFVNEFPWVWSQIAGFLEEVVRWRLTPFLEVSLRAPYPPAILHVPRYGRVIRRAQMRES
jgi:hypothetical protein